MLGEGRSQALVGAANGQQRTDVAWTSERRRFKTSGQCVKLRRRRSAQQQQRASSQHPHPHMVHHISSDHVTSACHLTDIRYHPILPLVLVLLHRVTRNAPSRAVRLMLMDGWTRPRPETTRLHCPYLATSSQLTPPTTAIHEIHPTHAPTLLCHHHTHRYTYEPTLQLLIPPLPPSISAEYSNLCHPAAASM